jgi:hypothetical protein
MTNLVAMPSRPPVEVASRKSTLQMVTLIAALLPPKVSEGLSAEDWMRKMVEAVGEHPQAVLDEAYRAVISTTAFAPTAKEIIDATLTAYAVLKLPMSPDAERHAAYRKKTSFRYVQGADGRQRFADDAKLAAIGFISLAGVHGNTVLDQVQDATVADVEKAIVATAKVKQDKPTIDGVITRIIRECDIAVAERLVGPPESLIDGPVATLPWVTHTFHLRSDFLCIADSTVARWRELGASDSAIIKAFMEVSRVRRRPIDYGPCWQERCERMIQASVVRRAR